MRYRPLGPTGFQVSVVSLGTWAIGGTDWGRVDDGDSIKAVHRAVDLGINLIDTAPLYGNGHAEEVLGEALKGVRKDVYVATKCGPVEERPGLLRVDLSPRGIEAQLEASLRRLRTDYVDLLQVHWPDPAWPIEDAIEGIQRQVQAGKARAVGVSNVSPEDLRRALAAGPVATVQPRLNLLARDGEKDLLPLCREAGLGVLAYEPLARGLLTGKYDPASRFAPQDIRHRDPRFRPDALARTAPPLARLAALARRNDLTPAQMAVAWVLSRPGITTAIVGAKTAAQVAENARAADAEPDAATLERMIEIVGG